MSGGGIILLWGHKETIGESDKSTIVYKEGRNYAISHSKPRLGTLSQDPLGKRHDSPEGNALVPKKIA